MVASNDPRFAHILLVAVALKSREVYDALPETELGVILAVCFPGYFLSGKTRHSIN